MAEQKHHLKKILSDRSEQHKEDLAREKRNYGRIRRPEEQVGTKTWKSYSRVRYSSKPLRDHWDEIDWGAD